MKARHLAVVIAASVAAAWCVVTPIRAHHAFAAEFDAEQPITLRGAVTRVEWINPHTWIHINVKGTDGAMTEWMIECGSPNTLYRRGFTKETLKPGIEVVVDGYRAKDGSHRANGRNLMLPNGQTLFLGSSGTGAPEEKR